MFSEQGGTIFNLIQNGETQELQVTVSFKILEDIGITSTTFGKRDCGVDSIVCAIFQHFVPRELQRRHWIVEELRSMVQHVFRRSG